MKGHGLGKFAPSCRCDYLITATFALLHKRAILGIHGSRVINDEESHRNPIDILQKRFYQSLWPKVGKWVTGDGSPYQYLVESIDKHPNQETLADMMRNAGLTHVSFNNLLGGAAAIHFEEGRIQGCA